jgi:hypothetical protein
VDCSCRCDSSLPSCKNLSGRNVARRWLVTYRKTHILRCPSALFQSRISAMDWGCQMSLVEICR